MSYFYHTLWHQDDPEQSLECSIEQYGDELAAYDTEDEVDLEEHEPS